MRTAGSAWRSRVSVCRVLRTSSRLRASPYLAGPSRQRHARGHPTTGRSSKAVRRRGSTTTITTTRATTIRTATVRTGSATSTTTRTAGDDPIRYPSYSYPSYSYPAYAPGGVYQYRYGYPTGQIRLQVRPRDAEVYVDGYYAGRVDDFDGYIQSLQIEEGPHTIEIVAPATRTSCSTCGLPQVGRSTIAAT